MGNTWQISSTTNTTIDPAHRRYLQSLLRTHNARVDLRGPDATDLCIRVLDAEGQIVGGLVGQCYWDWLVIDVMALEEAVRGQGIGARLLRRAEEVARGRGCRYAHTTTYAHQALGFYQRHGYGIVGELADYPAGHTLYWLRKGL